MSEIEKRLEEWIASCDCAESFHDNCTTANVLAAALLRARKTLRLIASEVEMLDYSGAATEALDDPELEELLR